MEFSCCYIHYNTNMASYMIFVRKGDLVYIDAQYIKVVIPFDYLYNDDVLYRYYLISLAMTEDTENVKYYEEGSWGNQEYTGPMWCISSKVFWKQMYFTCYFDNLVGFNIEPKKWVLSISSEKKINKFFDMLHNVEIISYPGIFITESYISSEIHEIAKEIDRIEKEITSSLAIATA